MKNFTWTVDKLLTLDEVKEKDFVVTAICRVVCTEEVDGKEYSAKKLASSIFQPEEKEGFIPYSELTEEQIVEWVKESLGSKGVESIEKSLASQVDKKINPPVVPVNKPLPW
jgi:DNA polymerase III delta subunit